MSYRICVVGVLVTLAVCSAGLLGAMHPPTGLLPVSGATDITIIMLGWNAWQMSYYTGADANQQLEYQGWHNADDRQYGPLSRAYVRSSSFGVGELREWAFVWCDPLEPQIAHIRVRRWIEFRWLKA
jgi:hypothetical protein